MDPRKKATARVLILCGVIVLGELPGHRGRADESTPPPRPFTSKCLVWFPAIGNPQLVNIWNNCNYCVVASSHWVFSDGRILNKNLKVPSAAQITISVSGTDRVFQIGERIC
jgi:hypothetical protein